MKQFTYNSLRRYSFNCFSQNGPAIFLPKVFIICKSYLFPFLFLFLFNIHLTRTDLLVLTLAFSCIVNPPVIHLHFIHCFFVLPTNLSGSLNKFFIFYIQLFIWLCKSYSITLLFRIISYHVTSFLVYSCHFIFEELVLPSLLHALFIVLHYLISWAVICWKMKNHYSDIQTTNVRESDDVWKRNLFKYLHNTQYTMNQIHYH